MKHPVEKQIHQTTRLYLLRLAILPVCSLAIAPISHCSKCRKRRPMYSRQRVTLRLCAPITIPTALAASAQARLPTSANRAVAGFLRPIMWRAQKQWSFSMSIPSSSPRRMACFTTSLRRPTHFSATFARLPRCQQVIVQFHGFSTTPLAMVASFVLLQISLLSGAWCPRTQCLRLPAQRTHRR